ncbi:S8 family serine peptidase [Solirubrobacter phytolaccae]|uniref:S8 family serine peptidase n=1 Tax=Solirubrobacter phytolaccae TaxID=1404360 RepID=A0A9X3NBI9_9ACTN|nr:S8 family serine peptidase [Solirubrobacter phytolaccae]MDA0181890.1 S8 family serine peptidase [Solirubrobacter phytolaccae]
MGLAALVAACVPAATADAAIDPQRLEALDRQGATEIVVRREPGLSAAQRADVRADADVELERRTAITDTELVTAEPGELAEAVAALNRDPDVVYAEPVTVMTAQTADPYFTSLWGLENTGQRMYVPNGGGAYYPSGTADADMDVPEAWSKATGAGVTVGIVDTGVLATNPDLANQLITNPADPINGVDDDGNGYVDDWRGWDFVTANPGLQVTEGDAEPGPDNDPQDNHGHGTHVAGTVAAQADNNAGITGVAYGAKIMPLRALGASGRGSSLAIAEAFDYAGKMGVRIVNASLGGPGLDQTQLAAVNAHPNTLYVIAAGNDNINNDVTPYGPCALPAANILCVGATDVDDRKASFSNYGAQSVDVFAPGTAILSTYIGPEYSYLQGTSMASPNTAGVAALVLSARPGLSALDIKSAIMGSVDAKADLTGRSVTGGRVNADRALAGTLGGAPANGSPPIISGTTRQGATLSTSTGYWDPAGTSYSYVWQRSNDSGASWTSIPGATASTYIPGQSDIGATLRVTVMATNPFGVSSATSAAVGPITSGVPVNIVRPTITGVLRRGQTLSTSAGWSPGGTTYAHQWERSADGGVTWIPIGTSNASYTLTTAERNTIVRVTTTAINAFGQTPATSDPTTVIVSDPPVNTSAPTLSGTTRRTFELTATTGGWDGSSNDYAYEWQREDAGGNTWSPIPGATLNTYRLTQDDEGVRVRVLVKVTNPDGTASEASDPTELPVSPFPPANTSAPTISGTPQRGKTLSATRGAWTGPDNMYSYQWQRDFGEGYVDIAGAVGAAYTLVAADVDALVRVVVTASNPDGTIVEASAATPPVLAAGPLNQAAPTVTGTVQRGLMLTGLPGTWSGANNAYAYRWQSSADGTTWNDIPGAIASSYGIVAGDVGRYLRLQVTVTNPDGTGRAYSTATVRVLGAPAVNTVAPAITGNVQRASVLSATRGTWSGNGNAYTYQWQRDGVNILDATATAYTPTVDDVGKQLRVVVTATNPEGSATASSSPTIAVPSSLPANNARPVVTGTASRGSQLSGTTGSWTGIGNLPSFQWQSSLDGVTWTSIQGATASSRVLATSDVGRYIRLLVTMTNPEGATTASSVQTAQVVATPPTNTARPVVTGTVQRAQTLVGTLGTWTGNDNVYDYLWQRSSDGTTWTAIQGATRPAYDLTVADVGMQVRLLITASNPDGVTNAASVATAAVPSAAPANTVRPTVTGTAKRGQTLTGATGTWTGIGNVTERQWQRSTDAGASWQDILGATGATYALSAADVGATLRLFVTVTNPEGSAVQTSLATATVVSDGPVSTSAPAISGTARRGSVLTATAGTWGGATNAITYQWQRSSDGVTWTAIAGADRADYELAGADVGFTVRVLVTATNPDGSSNRASAASATVVASPPVNVVNPTATGAAVRATTLSASTGSWTGTGNNYAMQWQRDPGTGFVDIQGATGMAYTLTVADVGSRIRVRVTASNADATVSAVSIGSAVVLAGPPLSQVAPTLSGTPKRAYTLTSTPGQWLGIENDYAYQWQRRATVSDPWTNIAGATGTAYQLDSADIGAQVRLVITASNADGSAAAATAPTAVVTASPPLNIALPTVIGIMKVGYELTASRGNWMPSGPAVEYAWQRDGVDIPGATGVNYTVQTADIGTQVRLKVTATNVDGRVSAVSAAGSVVPTPPANTVAPPIPTGTAREGSSLTGQPGTWNAPGATYTYSWYRCAATATDLTDASCERVASGSVYPLGLSDVGKRIGVRVAASSPSGDTVADGALSSVVGGLALANTVAPSVTGNAYVGEVLTGDPGRYTFPNSEVTFDWQRCAADGVTGCVSVGDGENRYRAVAADAGQTIVLVVTAGWNTQYVTARSTPVPVLARPLPVASAPPAVSGVTKRGQTLTAAPGTWSNSPTGYVYQWLRCSGADCSPIASAINDRYLLTPADIDSTIAVEVIARNQWGTGTARSAQSAAVVAGPPVNLQVPVISSSSPIIQQGATLSVGGYVWDATSDTVYSLSWERCDSNGCTPIAGATGDRYLLVAADVGFKIVAVSTAANVDGTVSARSAETVTTTLAGPRWKTLPTITGASPKVGDDVTITPGTWSGPPVVTDVTELMRCTNVCVSRGTASPYTIATGDLGAILRVRETASNVGGTTIVWSARYVGPVVSSSSGSLTLSTREAPVRNADGSTLAFARLSGGASAAAAKPKAASGPKVALRRPGKVKGKLVAWACPVSNDPGATPAPCSAKMTLKKKATLKLPAGTTGKVRVVVVKSR